MFTLDVQRTHPKAILPVMPQHQGDCGLDLATFSGFEIRPKSSHNVNLGIRIVIPPGYYGRVASRSGLSFKSRVEVGAGTVDSSYRGDLWVVLHNHSDEFVTIKAGDRVAQLIISPYALPTAVREVANVTTDTSRGVAGFGSTG